MVFPNVSAQRAKHNDDVDAPLTVRVQPSWSIQVGKGLGYGHVKLDSAEEAKNFIYRFDGFPAIGADELKVRVSKQALQGV